MDSKEQLKADFLNSKTIAVLGASNEKHKFGNKIYRDLKKHGYRVFGVNPNADTIEGDPCYAAIAALPEKPDGVVFVVPPAVGLKALDDITAANIERVWIQPGANSPEIEQRCAELGISCFSGKCIMWHLDF
ncbi:MAG: CoA-binding protein [Anaerolineaceae bacterium]|nr:CoA-binding protein [Anaerolineaceae bacterium]